MENPSESSEPRKSCKNCGKKMSKKGQFCPHCGQKDFDGRIRMGDLLSRFFSNITHLDNKFVKMCWQLLIPARVTLEYFQGKIKRYPHPIQFFFIVMFFFLLLFTKKFDHAGFSLVGGGLRIGERSNLVVHNGKVVEEINLMEALEHRVTAKNYREAYNALPASLKTEQASASLDSIIAQQEGPWIQALQDYLDDANSNPKVSPSTLDTLALTLVRANVRVAVSDLVELSPDSIIAKYGFKDWDQKITVRQGIKSFHDPRGLINHYVGSLGWALLVLVALMALVLKGLYWKRKRYYTEHFIFLMHLQSGIFLLVTLMLVISEYLFSLEWFWLVVIAWMAIWPLISLKRFYGEHWGWTVFKWLIYTVLYWGGLLMLFVGSLLVTFVLF